MTDDLTGYRQEIDQLDREILELLRQRFVVCDKIAAYKNRRGMSLKQPGREAEMRARNTALAAQLGLDEVFVQKLFELVIETVVQSETDPD